MATLVEYYMRDRVMFIEKSKIDSHDRSLRFDQVLVSTSRFHARLNLVAVAGRDSFLFCSLHTVRFRITALQYRYWYCSSTGIEYEMLIFYYYYYYYCYFYNIMDLPAQLNMYFLVILQPVGTLMNRCSCDQTKLNQIRTPLL